MIYDKITIKIIDKVLKDMKKSYSKKKRKFVAYEFTKDGNCIKHSEEL